MFRIAHIIMFVIALGTIGCGSDNMQQNNTATKSITEIPPPAVAAPKPNPTPPPVATTPVSAIPATGKPHPPGIYKVRRVAAAPTVQGAVEDSRASELATEILNLPLADRLEWTKQEFAKRGIKNVHDDQ